MTVGIYEQKRLNGFKIRIKLQGSSVYVHFLQELMNLGLVWAYLNREVIPSANHNPNPRAYG